MAMRNLGLINIFATTLMIPVFLSLYGLHRNDMLCYVARTRHPGSYFASPGANSSRITD
jgi:hypothetical protein